jgi:hypothetical protein
MSTADTQSAVASGIELPAVTLDGAPVLPLVALQNYEAIVKLTSEIFATDRITVTREFDPEIVGKEYWVVSVTTQGDVPELLAKDAQWHHRIWDVAPETASYYCLSLGCG